MSEAPAATPCDDCAAGCCREVHVVLSPREAVAMARALRVELLAIVELRLRERAEGAFRFRTSGDPADPRRWRVELRKVASADGGRRCAFLLELGTQGRCGIYAHRPVECRLYPTVLDGEAVGLRRHLPYCPPRSWSLGLIDVPLHALLHRREVDQRQADRAVEEEWNARLERDWLSGASRAPATERDLCEFLSARHGAGDQKST